MHQALFVFTERGRFELPLGVTLNLISSQTHSTTLPPLQIYFVAYLVSKAIVMIAQFYVILNLWKKALLRKARV